jgi:hypothetical protein
VGRCVLVLSRSHDQQLEPKNLGRGNHSTRRNLHQTGGPQFMRVGRGSQARKVLYERAKSPRHGVLGVLAPQNWAEGRRAEGQKGRRAELTSISDGAWRLAHEDHPLSLSPRPPDLIMTVGQLQAGRNKRSKSTSYWASLWRKRGDGAVLPMGAFGACPA